MMRRLQACDPIPPEPALPAVPTPPTCPAASVGCPDIPPAHTDHRRTEKRSSRPLPGRRSPLCSRQVAARERGWRQRTPGSAFQSAARNGEVGISWHLLTWPKWWLIGMGRWRGDIGRAPSQTKVKSSNTSIDGSRNDLDIRDGDRCHAVGEGIHDLDSTTWRGPFTFTD